MLKRVVLEESPSQAALRLVRDRIDVRREVTNEDADSAAREANCSPSVVHRAVAIKRYAPDLVDRVISDDMSLNQAYEAALKRRKLQGGPAEKTSRARLERDKRIAEMAGEGFSDQAIADEVGISLETLHAVMSKRLGIRSMTRRLGAQMRLDNNRIMDGLVAAAEPSLAASAAVDWTALDSSRIAGWQQRLTAAIHDLTVIRNKLRRIPRASE